VSSGAHRPATRTFSLIGTASAVLGDLAGVGSPNAIAIAGAVTGIGFARPRLTADLANPAPGCGAGGAGEIRRQLEE
jgi:hypothetical protein